MPRCDQAAHAAAVVACAVGTDADHASAQRWGGERRAAAGPPADIFHDACLASYAAALPEHTAPAGYTCPTCSVPILPADNVASPVAVALRAALRNAPWARRFLGDVPSDAASADGSKGAAGLAPSATAATLTSQSAAGPAIAPATVFAPPAPSRGAASAGTPRGVRGRGRCVCSSDPDDETRAPVCGLGAALRWRAVAGRLISQAPVAAAELRKPSR